MPAFSTNTKTFEGSHYRPGDNVDHFPEGVINMGIRSGGIVIQSEPPTFGDESLSESPEQMAGGEPPVDPVLDEGGESESQPESVQEQSAAVEGEPPATEPAA